MDHGLRTEWANLRGRPGLRLDMIPPATVRDIVGRRASNKNSRFGPGSKPDIQLGYRYQRAACLAELFAHGSTESRPTTSQSRQFLVGRRSAEPCLAPKRNKICLNFTMAAVLHDVPQRKFFRPYRYVSGPAETARIAASVFSSRRCRSRLSHTRLSLRATSSRHRSFCLRRPDLFNALGRR